MRAALSVIAGYATMFVTVFVLFTIAYLVLGADGAFKPGLYDPSTLWLTLSFVLGFVAAVVGGSVCVLIAKSKTGPMILIGVVMVLGILMAIPALMSSDKGGPPAREGDVTSAQAMQFARTPGWVAVLNPFVGAAGIFVATRLIKPQSSS